MITFQTNGQFMPHVWNPERQRDCKVRSENPWHVSECETAIQNFEGKEEENDDSDTSRSPP